MKCPRCVEGNKRSFVYVGMSLTTLMATHTYYDEDGKLHYDNPNKTTTNYSCSEGHKWQETI